MGSGKVFIIEDEFTSKVSLADVLKKVDLEVTTGSGEEVMAHIIREVPTLIVTDIDVNAPLGEETNFLQKIREDKALEKTDIFVYTAKLNVSLEVKLRKLKLDNYFIKDANTDFIVSSIKQFFEPHREEDYSLIDATRYDLEPEPITAEPQPQTEQGEENKENFGEMIQEFSDKVHSQLGGQDAETFYNLGVSYMDMGLYNEAIKEFNNATKTGQFKLSAGNMTGKCLCNLKKYPEAIAKFKETAKLTQDKVEMMGIKYEIGIALEEMGKLKEAFSFFGSIYKGDKSYRDVVKRLIGIKNRLKT